MNYVSEMPQMWTNKKLLNKMLPDIFCLFKEKEMLDILNHNDD